MVCNHFPTAPGLGPVQRKLNGIAGKKQRSTSVTRVRCFQCRSSCPGDRKTVYCVSACCKNWSAVGHFQPSTQTSQSSKHREDGATKTEQWVRNGGSGVEYDEGVAPALLSPLWGFPPWSSPSLSDIGTHTPVQAPTASTALSIALLSIGPYPVNHLKTFLGSNRPKSDINIKNDLLRLQHFKWNKQNKVSCIISIRDQPYSTLCKSWCSVQTLKHT